MEFQSNVPASLRDYNKFSNSIQKNLIENHLCMVNQIEKTQETQRCPEIQDGEIISQKNIEVSEEKTDFSIQTKEICSTQKISSIDSDKFPKKTEERNNSVCTNVITLQVISEKKICQDCTSRRTNAISQGKKLSFEGSDLKEISDENHFFDDMSPKKEEVNPVLSLLGLPVFKNGDAF